MLDVSACWIDGWLGDHLTDGRLKFSRIGLRELAIEIEVHGGLIYAVEALHVSEFQEAAITEAERLIGVERSLSAGWSRGEQEKCSEKSEKQTTSERVLAMFHYTPHAWI